jgi:hypothetical protein
LRVRAGRSTRRYDAAAAAKVSVQAATIPAGVLADDHEEREVPEVQRVGQAPDRDGRRDAKRRGQRTAARQHGGDEHRGEDRHHRVAAEVEHGRGGPEGLRGADQGDQRDGAHGAAPARRDDRQSPPWQLR